MSPLYFVLASFGAVALMCFGVFCLVELFSIED